MEVASLLARGLTNRQVAEALVISERTASTHVTHILTGSGSPPAHRLPPGRSSTASCCDSEPAITQRERERWVKRKAGSRTVNVEPWP